MKTAVYFCSCGDNITERIDFERLKDDLSGDSGLAYVKPVGFLCAAEGKEFLKEDLLAERPDRVVIAACSPREYEKAFMQVLAEAGINPYLLQMVNIREQVAWVTPEADEARQKAGTLIRAAARRVALHQPLEKKQLEARTEVIIIGAGPAGLKSALMLAQAGRPVVLVEKTPVLGGLPVRYEELFPNMECGPCMLEPVMGEILHGEYAPNIEILTLAEVIDVAGYLGNFTVQIRQKARYVDTVCCIGCGECIPPCPVSVPNEFDNGLGQRKAISLAFAGALPNVPFLDAAACLRWKDTDCDLCRGACPVEGAVRFEDQDQILERKAGAIIVATGSALYDCRKLPQLGYGSLPGVYTSLEFERLAASNGPTGGSIVNAEGNSPDSIAIVHCVGSLDERHKPYCSGICCEYAFKFNHLVAAKLPGTKIYHLYKELVTPGKEGFALCRHAAGNPDSRFIRYSDIADLQIRSNGDQKAVHYRDAAGREDSFHAAMVILCPAVEPAHGSAELGQMMDVETDRSGFFEELHGALDSARSKVKGVYLAGACQGPMNIQKSVSQGMAAAGYILSELREGTELQVDPVTASVNDAACSGCHICRSVCPYKAISYTAGGRTASINALLCHGCGTCVAACPAGAIIGNHFTNDQILAEMEAILQ